MEIFENLNPVLQALIAGLFTWSITMLGALVVVFFKNVNRKILNTILGFSAGIMIAAAFWSLLLPAIEISKNLGIAKWAIPSLGFMAGGLFVLLADKFLDKNLKNNKNLKNADSLKKVILFVIAITIHNIPEGLSVGVAFGGIACQVPGVSLVSAIMLTIGIGIQNFPEGVAVALPLRSVGYSRLKSFLIGQGSSLVEPIFAIVGAVAVLYIQNIMPFLLCFAAGAMIIVVARELLPEAVTENKNLATIGLIIGFLTMMILELI